MEFINDFVEKEASNMKGFLARISVSCSDSVFSIICGTNYNSSNHDMD